MPRKKGRKYRFTNPENVEGTEITVIDDIQDIKNGNVILSSGYTCTFKDHLNVPFRIRSKPVKVVALVRFPRHGKTKKYYTYVVVNDDEKSATFATAEFSYVLLESIKEGTDASDFTVVANWLATYFKPKNSLVINSDKNDQKISSDSGGLASTDPPFLRKSVKKKDNVKSTGMTEDSSANGNVVKRGPRSSPRARKTNTRTNKKQQKRGRPRRYSEKGQSKKIRKNFPTSTSESVSQSANEVVEVDTSTLLLQQKLQQQKNEQKKSWEEQQQQLQQLQEQLHELQKQQQIQQQIVPLQKKMSEFKNNQEQPLQLIAQQEKHQDFQKNFQISQAVVDPYGITSAVQSFLKEMSRQRLEEAALGILFAKKT